MRSPPSLRNLALLASRPLLAAFVAGAGLFAALGPGCSTGDQACTPSSDVTDTEDPCPYGAPGGPQVATQSCAIETSMPPDCQNWGWDKVYELFDTGEGACIACHTSISVGNLYIPRDPAQAYAAITSFSSPKRGRYVVDQESDETAYAKSWFVCNLIGDRNGGSPMPKPNGLTNPDNIQLVKNWYACGAYGPGDTTATTGGGGAGGVGGAGGAGGVGGAGGAGGI